MKTASWKKIKLAGLITIQPFFGGEERTESEVRLEGAPIVSRERTDWLWKAFLPEGADRNHEAAYVFSPATELGNQPKFINRANVPMYHNKLRRCN
jgi:alpha/beta hydrolase fold